MANKYNAKRTACNQGHSHPSKKEARHCNDLHIRQMAGEITDLEYEPQFYFVINGQQVKHENGRRVGMKTDFLFVENGVETVNEVKANSKFARSNDYPLRKAIFKALFPHIDFREV